MWIQVVGLLTMMAIVGHLLAAVFRQVTEARAIEQIASGELTYLRTLTQEAEARGRIQRERTDLAWSGWRKFRISTIADEAKAIKSFYLVPHDKKPLPPFLPGQHVTLQVKAPNQLKPLIRCYSLSCAPNRNFYRISVKKEAARSKGGNGPEGIVSSFLHRSLCEGDFLDVKSPSGAFSLDLSRHSPIVLIGGGIGITPVFSMLDSVIAQDSKREIWFFLGVRNRQEHPMRKQLADYASQHDNVRLVVCYSNPTCECQKEKDYHFEGIISAELMRNLLPSSNYDFYFCGPPGMMNSLYEGLKSWGVPDACLHHEAFGPAAVGKISQKQNEQPDRTYRVTFVRSNKTLPWTPREGSLLDLAEAHGIPVDSGCRAGNCGTCATAIRSGAVDYLTPPGELPKEGTCLICAAVPASDLEIDS